MPLTKTPTSSLSAIELLVMRIWYRGLAETWRMYFGRASPQVLATRPSPATRIPQEIVEIIIAHLIYDRRSLLACSLTCYSWYIAAVPHLHHTFITLTSFIWGDLSLLWPKPLLYKHRLGLLFLVKKLQIRGVNDIHPVGFSPSQLSLGLLPLFYALNNVKELEIDYLDIPGFKPWVRQYFSHLLPTVRSLTLREPRGSYRQIIWFIGLFQHLEDLGLLFGPNRRFPEEQANDLALNTPFAPPLRGRLTMTFISSIVFLKDMIDLLGGIQFRQLDLFHVHGMSLLLKACAETLETLRFHPNDSHARSALRNASLSWNKSLRTLELTASSINDAMLGGSIRPVSSLLEYAFSTITSTTSLQVVVFYRDHDFGGVHGYWLDRLSGPFRKMSKAERTEEILRHHKQFQVFRKVQKVRDFQLVLCADVWHRVGEYSMQVLKRAVEREKAKGVFDGFSSKPVVVHSPRVTHANTKEELYAAGYNIASGFMHKFGKPLIT